MPIQPHFALEPKFNQNGGGRHGALVSPSHRRDVSAKRMFDVTAALLALIVLLPLFVLICLLILSYDRAPAIYRHRRLGRGHSTFECLKFRTMRVDSQEALREHLQNNPAALAEWSQTQKLRDDPRITPVGNILRKTSLDELPQLINVIRGEMSLVGPRPIVSDEIEKYGAEATAYFAVRPGLTGAWQVSGRSDLSYAERVRLDRLYVETQSFLGDMRIIAQTIPAVFFSKGSY